MVVSFSSFTTIFFFLVTLIIIGMIFEKQFIALEDKFDAWVASRRKNSEVKAPVITKSVKKVHKNETAKNDKYRGFAA